ncbi:MAG TPA: toll/interleukin-1 receptor domain-containing protein [Parafilimonas sp.]|nr:toll/interleukin-1 receptor domain-containing protein [Parafilimonas sp.]
MSKPKIFVSHTSKETELARLLKKHLIKALNEHADIFVSSDGKSILAGSNWLNELKTALEGAEIEIILCSQESIEKPWINFEAGAGWIRGIQIIPLCHSGMKLHDLPVPLNLLQGFDTDQPENLRLLFESIAQKIGCPLLKIDYGNFTREIKKIEQKYKYTDHIEDPKILCAASTQYSQYDFELDIKVLEKAFPGNVTIERNLTSKRLRELLTEKHFDIIHLVVAVNNINGELLFSDVDSHYNPVGNRIDRISADGFSTLVTKSNTNLIVLATCHALCLAVKMAKTTNMIATNSVINGESIEEWNDWFYDLLSKGNSLFEAFEITNRNITSVPLLLVEHKNVVFGGQKSK